MYKPLLISNLHKNSKTHLALGLVLADPCLRNSEEKRVPRTFPEVTIEG